MAQHLQHDLGRDMAVWRLRLDTAAARPAGDACYFLIRSFAVQRGQRFRDGWQMVYLRRLGKERCAMSVLRNIWHVIRLALFAHLVFPQVGHVSDFDV